MLMDSTTLIDSITRHSPIGFLCCHFGELKDEYVGCLRSPMTNSRRDGDHRVAKRLTWLLELNHATVCRWITAPAAVVSEDEAIDDRGR